MKPKKSFGQNFLVNKKAAQRIAALLEPCASDYILEIGGGRGDLTEYLLKSGAQIYCVEIDTDLIAHLNERFAEYDNFHLIESDILEFDPSSIPVNDNQIKLIGNIPYNISSPIIEWMINNRHHFPDAVFTMQREVVDRITASSGNKQYGSLTLFVALFYDSKRIFTLKPGSFYPKPKVSSAVVLLNRLSQSRIMDDEYSIFRRLTSASFRWRRKQIFNILRNEYCLTDDLIRQILSELSISTKSRPEQLEIDQFISLARKLSCSESLS